MLSKQPWIGKPLIDIVFILLPPFLSLLIIVLFPSLFQDNKEMPVMGWVILVMLIDVSHVYSTLYRTYFDPQALRKQRSLLWTIPFFSFVMGVILYSIDDLLFWRVLAYVAVFHFVRQQYGFMRVYSRKEKNSHLESAIDRITIYYATLYPVLFWHFSGPRNFNWFIEKDFIYMPSQLLLSVAGVLYVLVLASFIGKEVFYIVKTKTVNLPKLGIIIGTILSWYFGIVYYNGDMAFTLLNVVSHGVPYMAMVWIYGQKNYTKPGKGSRFLKLVFSRYGFALFLVLLGLFAFVEEGLWDIAVWKEHATVFGFQPNTGLQFDHTALSIIVPLLSLPQVTHYVLDGFIWKIKQDEFKWNNEVKAQV
ncbi:MAG TPA: hypothetical protein VD794_08475 [Flavisolibacter sp.]|nr:hypothetical protein [Flavisolibacter sp.]